MKTGYEVTIRAFIPVDNADPDSVIAASAAVKVLSKGGDVAIPNFEVGNAFGQLIDVRVTSKFVNRRDPKPDQGEA